MKPYIIRFESIASAEAVVWANSDEEAEAAAKKVDTSCFDWCPEDTNISCFGPASSSDVYELDNYGPSGNEYSGHVCGVCGKPIETGYVDDDTCICEKCFAEYMDSNYGRGNWFAIDDDDGANGYYLYRDNEDRSLFHGTGIYYTEWED